jgi:regulator of nucleoside diphosphate kinase
MMNEQTLNTFPRPRIRVSDADYRRLSGLAAAAETRFPDVAEELQTEMDRAEVVAAEALPADVVRMGSTVEYRADNGERRRVTLVYPADADIAEGRVSVLTPIGAALIGLSAGQSMRWVARDGRERTLTVIAVAAPVAA